MRGVRVVRSVSRAGYQPASTSQNGRNIVHEIGHPFYASPPNGSNQSTRSVHIKQTPNPATLFPSPPPPILFFSVVVAASHAAFFQALPLSFSPSVVGPASNAARPLRLLPPLSSSTLVIEDPGFFACIPAPSHGATPQAFPPPQPFGVTVKRRVPMRVTSLASYPTKISTR